MTTLTLNGGYRLSSGREFSANGGFISIVRHKDGTFEICQGYDGAIYGLTSWSVDADDDSWTPDERRELADFMIAQWAAFKDSIG